jgi:hypothetical protein
MKMIRLSLVFAIVLMLFIPIQASAKEQQSFIDMPENWSREALTRAVDNGLLSGYKDRLYPEKNLTRAEMVAVINRAFGAKDKEDISNYTDVKDTDWFYDEISKAVGMGIFQGYANQLRPNDPITREEVFSVLANALKLRSKEANKLFMDSNEVSVWARESINGMINEGYIDGSDGKLNPKANITRAEFAQVMHNIIKDYINTPTVYEEVNAGNVIVNTPNATLKNVTVKGDLIIAEGVGEGEITLDNVKVEGRMLVRAGGENSIVIKGDSEIGSIIIVKQGNRVRVLNETGKEIAVATVEGTSDVILEGKFKNVVIQSANITVYARDTEIANLEIDGVESKVTVDEDSKIEKIDVRAANVVIEGEGTVKEVDVQAGGTGTEITTPDSLINVNREANNVVGTGGIVIEPNETYVNGKTVSQDAKPLKQPKSKGGSSGRNTTTPITKYTVVYTVVGRNGTLTGTVTSGNSVNSGTSVTFTASPSTGYEIKEWKVNGVVTAVSGSTLTITVSEPTTVTVEFEPILDITYEILIFVENVDGSTVVVKDSENTVIPAAKIQGKNYFYDLNAGTYTYTVEKSGYYTVEKTIVVSESSTEYVTMVEVLPGIVAVNNPSAIELNVGQDLPTLPATVDIVLDTLEEISVPVTWDVSSFNKDIADNYVIKGILTLPDGVDNPMDITAQCLVYVFAAPEITMTVSNSSILRFDFDVPNVWLGDKTVMDIGTPEYTTLAFLQDLFNDPTLDANVLNEENTLINYGIGYLEIELLDDAINRDLFFNLDHPEGVDPGLAQYPFDGDGNGVYRKDLIAVLSIFNNHLGLSSKSVSEPFKLKFFIPMENGIVDYSQPIQGVWQTQEQSDAELDPVLDTTPPEFVSISPEPGGEIWLESGDPFTYLITASDDNIYRFTPSKSHDFWYYALKDPYNGDEDLRARDQSEGVTVTYHDGTWEIAYDSISHNISLFADFEDYAGNRWSDIPEYENDMERFFDFNIKFLDRSELEAIKAEIDGLNPTDYSTETWNNIEIALTMPESTQAEIESKLNALLIAKNNLYELLVGYDDNYTIYSKTINNAFYVLGNDKGTGITLISATNGKFGTTTAYMDRIEYTPNPDFSGQDTFSYTVSTECETSDVTVFVNVKPSGTYMTSGYTSDGTEFGFYYDEDGVKVVIEDENSREVYITPNAYNFEVIDGELDVTFKYYMDDDLYTKKIGIENIDGLKIPVVLQEEISTPLQAIEIEDVNGVGLNEIKVGKTYMLHCNKVPSDSTDIIQIEWEIVSGNATINNIGELVANSPGEIVVRVYNLNTAEIGEFSDEITLTAYEMYTVRAEIVGTEYGTLQMFADGVEVSNPSEVTVRTVVAVKVIPIDPTVEVVGWFVDGVKFDLKKTVLEVLILNDIVIGVELFKPE